MSSLNLSMSEGDKDALKLTAKRCQCASVSELVRDAVPVYARVYQTVARGGTVVLRDSKGNEQELAIPRFMNPYVDNERP